MHTPNDVEYSILKQRIARYMRSNRIDIKNVDLRDLTYYVEDVVSENLQSLIDEYISQNKAEYAVVTGIQIHYCSKLMSNKLYETEFIEPKKFYVNKNKQVTHINLDKIMSLTPR